ncbi:uncharacterized protein B0H18DRAFT_1082437 [Fomitopsis serialis]|uniref:uncharacterized protein n=1 Tax=Fomitopsis serialis TaxID=139415 RepID=UPI00200864D3|nr:uncharacterized protein B0H18DRAFT_1082437 [Neoantrodia serialis]KAH9935773.1 hypothetical protein B0H18DRAFT_1082437 [Neoantrodia serialis]
MAHRRTPSARFPDLHMYGNGSTLPSPVLESPPFTPAAVSFAALSSIASRKPRSYWYRTTFLALLALVVLSVYILLVAQPSLSSIPAAFDSDSHPHAHLSPDAFRLAALRHKHPWSSNESTPGRPHVQLNASQELAAVSSFIASLPQNVIPGTVDPSQPIDPQLEVETIVKDVWAQHPVMLYSKFYSPVSRELKQMLGDLYLQPAPTIIEVDQRVDEGVLAPLLFRLTGKSELPILLVGGRPLGTLEEIRYLKKKGELQRMVTAAGAEVYGARRKQKKLH